MRAAQPVQRSWLRPAPPNLLAEGQRPNQSLGAERRTERRTKELLELLELLKSNVDAAIPTPPNVPEGPSVQNFVGRAASGALAAYQNLWQSKMPTMAVFSRSDKLSSSAIGRRDRVVHTDASHLAPTTQKFAP